VKRVNDPLLKFCAERGDLLDRMTDTATQYAAAANELAKRMGVLPGRNTAAAVMKLRVSGWKLNAPERNTGSTETNTAAKNASL
jgi:hypothetical protein